MPTIIAQRLRLLLDVQKWNRPQLLDALTSAAPVIASGADLQIELLITDGGATLFDYTNVASITIELTSRTNPLANNIIFSQSVDIASITTGATLVNFQAGTAQAIAATIANARTQLALNQSSTYYTFAVYAVSTDATARNRPLLVMDISAVDAGLPLANPSLPVPFKVGTKLPFVCSDAQTRDVTFARLGNGRWSLDVSQVGYNGPGQTTYALFCSDGLYRDLTLPLVQGVWTLDVGQAGHS